ncbi:PaaI family thioesterase [Kitasatospora phosalacinea]|uniref:PaaI family thioesterase n=1 Tax=Kitasatospora phosalacinea TaxID=2065 RepID=UPI0036614F2A
MGYDVVSCPFAAPLHLVNLDTAPDRTALALPVTSAVEGMPGAVHGTAIATLVDTACWMAVSDVVDPGGDAVYTKDIHLRYLTRVPMTVDRIVAEANLLTRGGRTAVAQAVVTDDTGVVYAHATASFSRPHPSA